MSKKSKDLVLMFILQLSDGVDHERLVDSECEYSEQVFDSLTSPRLTFGSLHYSEVYSIHTFNLQSSQMKILDKP